MAILVGGFCIFNLVGDSILNNLASDRCPIGETHDKIEWTEKPNVSGPYLVMSGQTKGGAQIHDVYAESGGGIWPAFSLIEAGPEGQIRGRLASIWPQDFESAFGENKDGRMFAEAGGYDVSSSGFYVKVRLSKDVDAALDDGKDVVVVVFQEQLPESELVALDAECIEG